MSPERRRWMRHDSLPTRQTVWVHS